jgi:hypothetical protein
MTHRNGNVQSKHTRDHPFRGVGIRAYRFVAIGTLRVMATWADVARLALSLPQTSEAMSRDQRAWRVKDKGFVWERPLRRSDLEHLGDAAPRGPILGARVEHEGAKRALIETDPDIYFTTPHFDGYPAILVQLDHIGVDELTELVTEAWLAQAPRTLVKAFLADSPRD